MASQTNNGDAPDGLRFTKAWISNKELLSKLLSHFMYEVENEQAYLKMYGKTIPVPRLISCMADPNVDMSRVPEHTLSVPFTEPASQLRTVLEKMTGRTFPYAEINIYRGSDTGNKDHIGLHRDKECGPGQFVACVTLGGARKLRFVKWPVGSKKRDEVATQFNIDVGGGDLYVMDHETCNTGFKHAVVKTAKPVEARIAITFREMPVQKKK
jgi:alkylated DNA repair dioxygenase AlkB